MTKERKNTNNKNSETITAAATKLLSNNNIRKYTKKEANFRPCDETTKSCANCFHPQTSNKINLGLCNIVDIEECSNKNTCNFQIPISD